MTGTSYATATKKNICSQRDAPKTTYTGKKFDLQIGTIFKTNLNQIENNKINFLSFRAVSINPNINPITHTLTHNKKQHTGIIDAQIRKEISIRNISRIKQEIFRILVSKNVYRNSNVYETNMRSNDFCTGAINKPRTGSN